MHERLAIPFRLAAAAAALAFCASAGAAQIQVTIENLVPATGISFAPLHVGFGSGSFDSFNIGQAAGPEIVSVAELGGGSEWQAAFAAAEPNATRGTIGGALLPGASSSATFMVDATSNPFFTFAAMVLPSNDHFIGNDSPMQYRLFNAAGQLAITSIVQYAGDIWDAGSETFDPAAAAFVVGSVATDRSAENGVVGVDFAKLQAVFNGQETAGGYVLNSALTTGSEVYRISFQAVPEPESLALMLPGLLAIGWVGRQRRKQSAGSALSPV